MDHLWHPTEAARQHVRRNLVIVLALALLISTAIIMRLSPKGAHAESITTSVSANCAALGTTLPLDVPITVTDNPDPVDQGGKESLTIESGLPSMPLTLTVNSAVITMPIPSQIASIDSVTFGTGNVTAAWKQVGTSLVLTYTGPVSSDVIQIPPATINGTVGATAVGPIEWKTFSSIESNVDLGGPTNIPCTPADPNLVLNSTVVNTTTTTAKPTTTTAKPTTTTTAAPTTTTTAAPTTTTTAAPTTTTTAAPTTTTTAAPTTTTTAAPTTTTTAAPTTTTTAAPTTTTTTPKPPPSGGGGTGVIMKIIHRVVALVMHFLIHLFRGHGHWF